jgi:histidine triad (HIT) family protein
MGNTESVFEKIMAGKIPARVEYEDDRCLVIRDIEPQAPVHCLVIPRKKIERVAQMETSDEPLLGHLLWVANRVAAQLGLEGYRLVINNGPDAGETVPHLHLHLLGGRRFGWPPG